MACSFLSKTTSTLVTGGGLQACFPKVAYKVLHLPPQPSFRSDLAYRALSKSKRSISMFCLSLLSQNHTHFDCLCLLPLFELWQSLHTLFRVTKYERGQMHVWPDASVVRKRETLPPLLTPVQSKYVIQDPKRGVVGRMLRFCSNPENLTWIFVSFLFSKSGMCYLYILALCLNPRTAYDMPADLELSSTCRM
jgi:hypothetical protein